MALPDPDLQAIRVALEIAEAELPADRYATIKPANDAVERLSSRLAAAERAIRRGLAPLAEYDEASRHETMSAASGAPR